MVSLLKSIVHAKFGSMSNEEGEEIQAEHDDIITQSQPRTDDSSTNQCLKGQVG